MSEYPSPEWFANADNWQRWSTALNLRFNAELVDLARSGTDLGQAVNDLISTTAANLLSEGVPASIVVAFIQQYQDNRAMLMESAAVWIDRLPPHDSRQGDSPSG